MAERISLEEFERVKPTNHPRTRGEVGQAVGHLPLNSGFKVPCKWKHSRNTATMKGNCGGAQMAYKAAKATGVKVSTTCQDGTLYVFRRDT